MTQRLLCVLNMPLLFNVSLNWRRRNAGAPVLSRSEQCWRALLRPQPFGSLARHTRICEVLQPTADSRKRQVHAPWCVVQGTGCC